jgi:hypothetical protein
LEIGPFAAVYGDLGEAGRDDMEMGNGIVIDVGLLFLVKTADPPPRSRSVSPVALRMVSIGWSF